MFITVICTVVSHSIKSPTKLYILSILDNSKFDLIWLVWAGFGVDRYIMVQNKQLAILLTIIAFVLLLSGCGKPAGEEKGDLVVVQSIDANKVATQANLTRFHPPLQPPVVAKDELLVKFFNVFDADATLIRTPSGITVLIDCGDTGTQDVIISTLVKMDIQQLDYLVLSDPLLKNIGGCNAILKQIPAIQIIANAQEISSKPYRIFDAKAKASAKNYTKLKGNKDIVLDKNIVLHLRIPYTGTPENRKLEDNSIVVQLLFNDVQLLFMGDCNKNCEPQIQKFIERTPIALVKLANQGSSDGTTLDFINATRPKAVFISVGANNPYGAPSRDMLRLLYNSSIPYYRTDYHGDILLRTDGTDFSVNTQNRYD